MADKINSYVRPDLNISRSGTKPADRAGDAGGKPAESSATPGRDAVSLTDAAARLKRIESGLAQLPDVDRARVEAMRERVESGDYSIDAGRLADKLLRIEQGLG